MIVWGFIAIAFVAVLIFPKRWLAAAFAVGFAARLWVRLLRRAPDHIG